MNQRHDTNKPQHTIYCFTLLSRYIQHWQTACFSTCKMRAKLLTIIMT